VAIKPEDWQREGERIMAAAFRRSLSRDMIPLALALLDTEVGDMIEYADGTYSIWLETSPETYDVLAGQDEQVIDEIFRPIVRDPADWPLVRIRVRLTDVEPDWRTKAAAAIGPGKPVNQGSLGNVPVEWHRGGYVRKEAVLGGQDRPWPVCADDLRTVVGELRNERDDAAGLIPPKHVDPHEPGDAVTGGSRRCSWTAYPPRLPRNLRPASRPHRRRRADALGLGDGATDADGGDLDPTVPYARRPSGSV
jgi:hypothetical protein